ncbi:hypothetical protein ASPACDRAFT_48254 [Aspergillus aculeatus ATCC 16872]|uniref:Ketoreductase (KR) domain-containing protein n=1 Tax=Aspergillus aculeatus (strain ATCC 16872 / CBS 172.66 / WB 5094) TaxID=690307 RepID=A0A1L9WG52_ASPA1|nr:uncharacterized protein ASPACDRAFT_48254 [Aspergillus aculeatus ATCC 16872]OJJ95150.1 hypothetical protein ASPACDRAFT_48254 [Aspergillus aculeatus ATCC 16872]
MPSAAFNPDTDIPSLSGKVILITGGTAGLGTETARQLAKHGPAHIYISGRSASSADTVISQIQSNTNPTNTTETTPFTFLSRVTVDGYEIQFGTNHLGHALLIQKLPPQLQATAAEGHDVRVIAFDSLRTTQEYPIFAGWIRYGQSKLANLLYARELAHRYPELSSISLTHGVVNTGLVGSLGCWNRAFAWVTNLGQVKRFQAKSFAAKLGCDPVTVLECLLAYSLP